MDQTVARHRRRMRLRPILQARLTSPPDEDAPNPSRHCLHLMSPEVTEPVRIQGDEADAVAGVDDKGAGASEIEQTQGGPPDDPPSTGAIDRIDAGLLAADGHRAAGDAQPGRGQA